MNKYLVVFGVPYPTHGFFTPYQWSKVVWKRLYMYKKGAFFFLGGGGGL